MGVVVCQYDNSNRQKTIIKQTTTSPSISSSPLIMSIKSNKIQQLTQLFDNSNNNNGKSSARG